MSCRSASTSSPTSSDESRTAYNRPPRADRPDPATRREVADDRRRLQAARARVPGDLDLEDPLPGGPEASAAAPDAGRLPPLHAGRRTAPAHDPAPAARRVPAAEGD